MEKERKTTKDEALLPIYQQLIKESKGKPCKTLMVLGASPSQLPTILKAKEMGLEVIIVDRDVHAVGVHFADLVIPVSVTHTHSIVAMAKALSIDGIIAPCGDIGTPTVGSVVTELGLHGIDSLRTQNMNDKRITHQILKKEGILVPKRYQTPDEATYPLIVKPCNGVASRGVYKIDRPEDLPEITEETILEEYIEGDLFSISLLLQDGIAKCWEMVDQVLSKNNFGTHMFTHFSKHVNSPVFSKIIKETIKVYEALAIREGTIEIEGIVKDGEVYFIDINPRMAGGHLMEAFSLASNIDWLEASIKIALGEHVPLQYYHSASFALALVGSEVGGTIRSIDIHKKDLTDNSTQLLSLWKKCGDKVESVLTKETSSDQTIYVLYTEDKKVEPCVKRINKVIDKVKITVE